MPFKEAGLLSNGAMYSNPAVAEVSVSGAVTAVSAGSAVITVTYQEKAVVVYVTVN